MSPFSTSPPPTKKTSIPSSPVTFLTEGGTIRGSLIKVGNTRDKSPTEDQDKGPQHPAVEQKWWIFFGGVENWEWNKTLIYLLSQKTCTSMNWWFGILKSRVKLGIISPSENKKWLKPPPGFFGVGERKKKKMVLGFFFGVKKWISDPGSCKRWKNI